MEEVPLRYLDTGEMLAVSGALTGDMRAQFESIPEVKPLAVKLDRVHKALIAAAPPAEGTSEMVRGFIELERILDLRHDHALRALYHAHVALQHFVLSSAPPDAATGSAIAASREKLLPLGLKGTQASYTAEEGNAAQTLHVAKTDAAVAAVLGKLTLTAGVSGMNVVERLADLGAQLGDAERKKNAAIANETEAGTKADEPSLRDARNDWIHVVGAVLRMLDLADAAPAVDEVKRAVAEPALKAAVRDSVKRAKAAKAAGDAAAPGGADGE